MNAAATRVSTIIGVQFIATTGTCGTWV